MKQQIEAKVCAFISQQMNVPLDQLHLNTSFQDDLGMDSLELVEMVMQMEETFTITIPDNEAANIQTISDAVNMIQEKSGDTQLVM